MKRQKGSLTVEASIVMPVVICVVVSLAFIIKAAYTHEVIQHAVNETANEISTYSYLCAVSGLKSLDNTISEGLEKKSENSEDLLEKLLDGYDALGSLDGEKLKDAFDAGKEIADNPLLIFKGMVSLIGEGAYNNAKAEALQMLAKMMMQKYLVDDTSQDVNLRLKVLNISGGLTGLDFSQSKLFEDGGEDIEIVVKYRLDLPLPIKLLPKMDITQRAVVRAWLDGESYIAKDGEDDIWDRKPFERGIILRKQFGGNLPSNYPVVSKFENGTATMIKSINLNNKTYQKPSNLKAHITESLNKLKDFKGAKYAGTTITEADMKVKELLIVIPKNAAITADIQTVLDMAYMDAAKRGIRLRIEKV